jgi:hypothetical protein
MTDAREGQISTSAMAAFDRAERFDAPYRHWLLDAVFPDHIIEELQAVEFPVGDLGGVSGKRELHNDQRHYVDQANMRRLPVLAALGNVFQLPAMAQKIEDFFGVNISGTFLRIEYAQDADGFWLEPHTDLGVKRLTVLVYLSDGAGHDDLGTDIYDGDKQWCKRAPFAPNGAIAFVPGDNTYHGFAKRPIQGVRKTLILNYVTTDWRDREQLAFPEATITVA